MRCLDRDRRPVFIARYRGMQDGVDEQGRLTGRPQITYDLPEKFWPTASAVRGDASGDIFGQALNYDRVLTVDNPAFPINEADILWIDADVEDDEHDYKVVRVARTGSYTVIAVSRVEVSR